MTKKPKGRNVSVRLTTEQFEKLKAAAAERGESFSELIRLAVDEKFADGPERRSALRSLEFLLPSLDERLRAAVRQEIALQFEKSQAIPSAGPVEL